MGKKKGKKRVGDFSVSELFEQLTLAWEHFGRCIDALEGKDVEPCDLMSIDGGTQDNCNDLELFYMCKRVGEEKKNTDGITAEANCDGSDVWVRGLSLEDTDALVRYIRNMRKKDEDTKPRFAIGDTVFFIQSRILKEKVVGCTKDEETGKFIYETENYEGIGEEYLAESLDGLWEMVKSDYYAKYGED